MFVNLGLWIQSLPPIPWPKGLGELFPGFDSVIYCWVTNYCRFIGCREHMCVSQFLLLESRRALDGPAPFRSFRKIKSRASRLCSHLKGRLKSSCQTRLLVNEITLPQEPLEWDPLFLTDSWRGGCPLFLVTWALPFGLPSWCLNSSMTASKWAC